MTKTKPVLPPVVGALLQRGDLLQFTWRIECTVYVAVATASQDRVISVKTYKGPVGDVFKTTDHAQRYAHKIIERQIDAGYHILWWSTHASSIWPKLDNGTLYRGVIPADWTTMTVEHARWYTNTATSTPRRIAAGNLDTKKEAPRVKARKPRFQARPRK